MKCEILRPEHAERVRALRIRAATEYPASFSVSAEEESALSIAQVADQLAAGPPNAYTLGVLEAEELLGLVNLVRYQRPKVAHKGMLGGMYVVGERQGQGLGRALLDYALGFAETTLALESVTLAVTAGNNAARQVYQRAGFVSIGVEPRYIRVGDEYFDIEWMFCFLGSRPTR